MISPNVPFFLACVLAFSVVAAVAQTDSPSESRPSATLDLSPSLEARDVLIEVTSQGKGKASMVIDGEANENPIDQKSTRKWVDRLQSRDPDSKAWHGERYYLEDASTQNGKITDSGLEGVGMDIDVNEAGELNLSVREPRIALKSRLNAELRQAEFAGASIPFKSTVDPTKPLNLTFGALFETLFDIDGEMKNLSAVATIEQIDEAADVIVFKVEATFEVIERKLTGAISSWNLELKMSYSAASRLVLSISGEGTSTLDGEVGGNVVSGAVEFKVTMKSKIVKDAASLIAAKPKFRPVRHRFQDVSFELPSCWVPVVDERPARLVFRDTRIGDPALEIQISAVDLEVPIEGKDFLAGFLDGMRPKVNDVKGRFVTTSVGSAVAYDTELKDGSHQKGYLLRTSPKQAAIILFVGADERQKATDPEFRRLLASLK